VGNRNGLAKSVATVTTYLARLTVAVRQREHSVPGNPQPYGQHAETHAKRFTALLLPGIEPVPVATPALIPNVKDCAKAAKPLRLVWW
jgi:hypothetical protein